MELQQVHIAQAGIVHIQAAMHHHAAAAAAKYRCSKPAARLGNVSAHLQAASGTATSVCTLLGSAPCKQAARFTDISRRCTV